MTFISKEDLQILGSLPLTEVMRNNHHRMVMHTKRAAYYHCPLPGHKDTDASFCIELAPSEDADNNATTFAAFNCMGCHNISGAGAIELQAALMGCSTTGQDFVKVVSKLVHDFHLQIEGVSSPDKTFTYVDPVNEFKYVETEWTDNHLRALGCSVQPKFVGGKTIDEEVATDENVYSWSMIGDISSEEQKAMPFDPNELGRIFGVYPISEFTTPATVQADGTMRSFRQQATEGYPTFIFKSTDNNGRWRIKKYEPYSRPNKDSKRYKWTWWYEGGKNLDRDFASAIYGDCDVMDALFNLDVLPQDTSTYHNHPVISKQFTDRSGIVREKKLFKRVVICSGPRDALQVYYHSDAHVVYPHSEHAKISLKSIHRLLAISEQVYILYDMDETGKRAARELNLEYLQMAIVNLPEDLATLTGRRTGKPCKDISDFFEQYWKIARYKSDLRRKTLNEMFNDMLQDAGSIRFWRRHNKKNSVEYDDGSTQDYVYEIDADKVLGFLSLNGMGIYKGKNNEEAPRFVHTTDNIVEFIPDNEIVKECKKIMKTWLSNHSIYNNSELRSTITKSTQIISKNLLEELPIIDINPIFWGPRYDYLFFSNGALHVTAKGHCLIPYAELDFVVNKEQILPYPFVDFSEWFTIERNPMFVEYEHRHNEQLHAIAEGDLRSFNEENERWKEEVKLWSYRLRLLKPMNDCPVAFQFLFDTCRMFWKKEQQGKREGKPWDKWLTPEQRQFQDMQFISKAAGLGYLLTRYRQPNMGRMVYIIDYSVDDEMKNFGGTGKSIIANMLQSVRHMYHIDGKAWKTSADMIGRNFVSYDYLKHGYIHIEDMRSSVGCEELFVAANSNITKKRLNKDEESIKAEYASKIVITSNKMFDLSDPSSERRLWVMPVSNYYHTSKYGMSAYDPFTKYGINIGTRDMGYDEWNAMVSMLVRFMEFYLSERTYIEAPQGAEGRHRLLANRKEFRHNRQFIDWADKLFEGDMFWGVPMPKVDLVVSYFQYIGREITYDAIINYARSKDFGEMLGAYCDTIGITVNPDISYKRKSDIGRLARTKAYVYEFGDNGKLNGRRHLDERASCYWFFRRGEEPTDTKDVMYLQHSDPACEGYILSED